MTKEIRIDIKVAIALCQIIDEYETFMKNLKQFTEKNETESYKLQPAASNGVLIGITQ